jgi:glycosyltransferase involved in cell wall biosynthesis
MKKLLFVISQLYKGGAETSLVNLLNNIDYTRYQVDLLILNQAPAQNAVSLVPFVNKNVNLCDAYAEYQRISILKRVKAKAFYTSEQKMAYYLPALEFVRNKMYDWAFFVGEWCAPSFVAYHTNARKKAAWIHCDLSLSENFDDELYFHFYECFDYYLFVSKNALEASVKKYPFLKEKAKVIYNINDVQYIKKRAEEKIDDFRFDSTAPTILTCANIRPEKNHIRQVQVLSELKRRGIHLNWVNIGSTADTLLYKEVMQLAKKEKVDDSFHLLGSKENPYKYMKQVDAVTVLSDYESWSMVITEAKILGIPVIATKTAGALEQIEHQVTGILTDFDVKDIADQIEGFLRNEKNAKLIRKNLEHFDNTEDIINSFYDLIEEDKDNQGDQGRILYIIDDVHYKGGAHAATLLQIKELVKCGKNITIFSNTIPDCKLRTDLAGVKFSTWRDITLSQLVNKRVMDCLFNQYITKEDKRLRARISYLRRFRKDEKSVEELLNSKVSEYFSGYDIACVMSEASYFRKHVALSACRKKIQWIHTDYAAWCNFNDWTKNITKEDGIIYSKFDQIVLLSDGIRDKFIKIYPELEEKATVIKNFLPTEDIITRGKVKSDYPSVHFVSVGRLGEEKAFERLINILGRLSEEGYQFKWEIIGDGPIKDKLVHLVNQKGLEKMVLFLGHKTNPYPYINQAQVFALLSSYEGMPNTIYEALILGVPVFATNVGGISEQINVNEYGWLVENKDESIYEGIKYILHNQDQIEKYKSKLKNYVYDNEIITKQVNGLFS